MSTPTSSDSESPQKQSKQELLRVLLRKKRKGNGSSLTKTDRNGQIPLSWGQEQIWFVSQLGQEASRAYHMPVILRMEGTLDCNALEKAYRTLLVRHEVLRTNFPSNSAGEPFQRINDSTSSHFEVHSLSDVGGPDVQQEAFKRLVDHAVSSPFDLACDNLIRCMLIRRKQDEHSLVIVMHHIISDAWSVANLLGEIVSLYEAYTAGRDSPLEELPIQYADYAIWQRASLREELLDREASYWKGRLEGAPILDLPTDRPRPAVQSFRGARLGFVVDAQLSQSLIDIGRQEGCTAFMTWLSVFSALLRVYSQQSDFCIGTPIANRLQSGIDAAIGFFVNTLALRLAIDDNKTFRSYLKDVKSVSMSAFEHQAMPFSKVVNAVRPERNQSHSPLFQVMMVFQNTRSAARNFPGLTVNYEPVEHTTSQFDLTLELEEMPDKTTRAGIEYSTELFDEATIARFKDGLIQLVESVVKDPDQKLCELQVIGKREQNQLLVDWNDTRAEFPSDKCIHELFERQVEKTPHAIAVECGNLTLTYAELNARSNQLARYCRKQGVGPQDLVAICIERSLEMVIGLIGILKAGAAYLPLDPDYPHERLEYMMRDAAPAAVLTQSKFRSRIPLSNALVVAVDEQSSEVAEHGDDNLDKSESGLTSKNLAYIIYTSGSTGRPKGVAIEHRNAVNLIAWAHSVTPAAAFEKVLLSTSLNFDLSVYECFVPLTVGGSVRVVTNALALVNEEFEVTLVNTVPSVLKGMLALGVLRSLPAVLNLAGEPLSQDLAQQIFESGRVEQINNLYGPTETTTYSTWISMDRQQGFRSTIGRPIANTKIYILDSHLRLVPVGVVGEIYIGGAGVARGYLNLPELTAERFLRDPFSADSAARMYKTGDTGRWRPDGTVEYLGRNDNQVKVRGFRIELGEIEARLSELQSVADVAVIARQSPDGDKQLVAFVVFKLDQPGSLGELRTHATTVLPQHMVPQRFHVLERIPHMPNGKVDRTTLSKMDIRPESELKAASSSVTDELVSPTERVFAGIWADLLKLESVSVHDDFFDLGGHSLMAAAAASLMKERSGLSLSVMDIFQYRTIRETLERVSSRKSWSPMVKFHTSGSAAPMYFIHPARGSVSVYSRLAKPFEGSHPCFGIQAYGLEPGQKALEDIEEIGKRYAEAIVERQGAGPCIVGGYCLGAFLAHEVTFHLQQMGVQVQATLMMAASEVAAFSGAGERMNLRDSYTKDTKFLAFFSLVLDTNREPVCTAEELDDIEESKRIEFILSKGKARSAAAASLREIDLRNMIDLYFAAKIALSNYKPHKMIASDLIYIRSKGEGVIDAGGWEALTTGKVAVREFGDDPQLMMKEDSQELVADILKHQLAEFGVSA